MTLYAEVILPLPLDQTFTYVVPEDYTEKVKVGARVLVPFKQKLLTGIVVKLRKRRLTKDLKLKEINELLDETPAFSLSFLSFARNLSEYYYSSWGELLQASLPPSLVLESKTRISISEEGKAALDEKSLSEDEKKILNFLLKKSYSDHFLRRRFAMKNFPSMVSQLERKGLIHRECKIKKPVLKKKGATARTGPTQLEMDFSLDEYSLRTSEAIRVKLGVGEFSPFFLFGPSEKREAVYFNLIKIAMSLKMKVLFLVPEISLTKPLQEKFERRFGENVALLHSQLTERMRELEWRRIKAGEADVVVGPRSALFSPLEDLGLVVVDEEQDESYYQQESPSYDARQGAWLRARQGSSVLVYGSADPSVEAFFRAKKKGNLLCLEKEPKGRRVTIVDNRAEKKIISRRLRERIQESLDHNEPILIFYNRRGYASFLICSRCSFIPRCIRCDIALTYHKREGKLICHYCNYSVSRMDLCPECGYRIIKKRGFGIEVVEEEIKRTFPQTNVASFNLDVVKKRSEQEGILSRFQKGKIDFLIGTQLLAHRKDLPQVSLVIILYPETTLMLSDFKASQKTYLNIRQMMKFLRTDGGSELLIQTAFPNHYSICLAAFDDYMTYFKHEIKYRRVMNYPPFSYMAEVLFQGENLRILARESRNFSSLVKDRDEEIEILGPAVASISRIRWRNRVQVILKTRKKRNLDKVLRESLKEIKTRKTVLLYE